MSAAAPLALAALWLALAPPQAEEPDAGEETTGAVTADNVSTRLGRNLWQWTAFIQAPEEVLARVQCVEYTLHPTFPDPVREVCDRGPGEHAFPITAKGWGTFPLHVRVTFTDGSTQELVHALHFFAPADAGTDGGPAPR